MLTGGTPKTDIRDINSRLIAMASSKGVNEREIKLCYVTVGSTMLIPLTLIFSILSAGEDCEE
jgi:hypothetical protein